MTLYHTDEKAPVIDNFIIVVLKRPRPGPRQCLLVGVQERFSNVQK